MVLGNFAVFLAILVGMGLKSVFFGRLRSVEYEVSLSLEGGVDVVFSLVHLYLFPGSSREVEIGTVVLFLRTLSMLLLTFDIILELARVFRCISALDQS